MGPFTSAGFKPLLRTLLGGTALLALLGAASSQRLRWFDAPDAWSDAEKAQLGSLLHARLPESTDPSNRYAALPAAAELGKRLFHDPRFSRTGTVSCASCHDPARQFQDDRPRGVGIAEGLRRTMPTVDLRHGAFFFWDGRKDSLWAQALGPLEDAKEHGGNRLRHAHLLQQHYPRDYEALFGPLPPLQHLAADAGPLGTPAERAAWAALDGTTQHAVSRVFANLGKAIAAYETTLRYGDSRADRYIAAVLEHRPEDWSVLNADEKAGLRLFIGKAQCATCHNGPLLSDQHFHNTGVPPLDEARPERGRAEGAPAAQADEFNCLGPFSDAPPAQCAELRFLATDDPRMTGAFKTPSLRNVALRPPYMHAGQFRTLEEVLRHYATAPKAAIGESELGHMKPASLNERELRQLAALLEAFTGPVLEGDAPVPAALTPPSPPRPSP